MIQNQMQRFEFYTNVQSLDSPSFFFTNATVIMFNLRSIEQGYNFVLLVSKYSWPITELHTTNKHCMYTEKSFEQKHSRSFWH